jgi:hypothetical protein
MYCVRLFWWLTCSLLNSSSGDPCICKTDFYGESCEYKRGAIPEEVCDRKCLNGGECLFGTQLDVDSYPYFSSNETASIEPMYCSCPDGFDGNYCEILRTSCGNDYCFHGGTCVEREVDGSIVHHCDCNSASNETVSYAGRFCQYEATSYCESNYEISGQLFCTNGGTCRSDPSQGCICDDRYAGFSCEFVQQVDETSGFVSPSAGVSVVDPVETYTCDLECENNGVCRNGIKDLDYLGTIIDNAPLLNDTGTDCFMHCVCPEGWTGLMCEEQLEVCGDDGHLCFHGSKCTNNGGNSSCDCSSTTSDIADAFAGDHCEHPVNDICTTTTPGLGQPLLYCVNNGLCNDYVAAGSQ